MTGDRFQRKGTGGREQGQGAGGSGRGQWQGTGSGCHLLVQWVGNTGKHVSRRGGSVGINIMI